MDHFILSHTHQLWNKFAYVLLCFPDLRHLNLRDATGKASCRLCHWPSQRTADQGQCSLCWMDSGFQTPRRRFGSSSAKPRKGSSLYGLIAAQQIFFFFKLTIAQCLTWQTFSMPSTPSWVASPSLTWLLSLLSDFWLLLISPDFSWFKTNNK